MSTATIVTRSGMTLHYIAGLDAYIDYQTGRAIPDDEIRHDTLDVFDCESMSDSEQAIIMHYYKLADTTETGTDYVAFARELNDAYRAVIELLRPEHLHSVTLFATDTTSTTKRGTVISAPALIAQSR